MKNKKKYILLTKKNPVDSSCRWRKFRWYRFFQRLCQWLMPNSGAMEVVKEETDKLVVVPVRRWISFLGRKQKIPKNDPRIVGDIINL